jgi:hypothetical protein
VGRGLWRPDAVDADCLPAASSYCPTMCPCGLMPVADVNDEPGTSIVLNPRVRPAVAGDTNAPAHRSAAQTVNRDKAACERPIGTSVVKSLNESDAAPGPTEQNALVVAIPVGCPSPGASMEAPKREVLKVG